MGRQIEGERIHGLTPEELEDMLRQMGMTEAWVRPPLPLVAADEDAIDVIEAQPDQASLTNRYLEQALRFIRREASAETPFFLYLAHMYVHLPIYVQERFKKASQNGDYGAAVECVDWVTGVLLAELEQLGIDDDTVVVFTSDNGALAVESGGSGSNAPLRGSKGTTWEGGQRVPGIIRWPGTITPGESAEVATQMDLYPTLASICGATVPSDRIIDGRDLSPRLGLRTGDDEPDADRPFFYFSGPTIEAVRRDRWKLHVRKQGEDTTQLFDLQDDIAETTDVADAHPEVVAELTALIDEARADLGHEAGDVPGPGLRPIGKVDDPVTLTEFDPDHPYFMAEYDLADRG
ncbi:MAG: hypothetical protein DHS20C19_09020 [Acidimicrobiales bacterium]|nr:MAG: hypothetical protein DHS20C19_09020 [Acidimicrobiales bacterium]